MISSVIGDDYVYLGPIAFAVYIILLLISLLLNPQWDFYSQALSDLGGSTNYPSAVAFELACVLSGFVLILYAQCRYERGGSTLDQISAAFFFFTAMFLIMVGVFPVSMKMFHDLSAVMFAICMGLAVAFATLAEILRGRIFLLYSGAIILVVGALILLNLYGSPCEFASILLVFAWSLAHMYASRTSIEAGRSA